MNALWSGPEEGEAPNIVMRVDVGPWVGNGHLSRCLALADALHARGARVTFLCAAEELAAVAGRIERCGHALIGVKAALGLRSDGGTRTHGGPASLESVMADAHACIDALHGMPRADWLVVDHYLLDAHWERAMRQAGHRMLAIDDLANRSHDVDVLLDQNYFPGPGNRYEGKLPANCLQLLGPSYALLRPEFLKARAGALERQHRSIPERVLVMYGGADPLDLAGKTVELLIELGCAAHVDVVAGPMYTQTTRLTASMARLQSGQLHVAPGYLAELMARADFAMGSPGVTSYERCCVGLPSLIIAVADNQEPLGRSLHDAGIHHYLGRYEQLAAGVLSESLAAVLNGDIDLSSQRPAATQICDGGGCSRVCEQLGCTA